MQYKTVLSQLNNNYLEIKLPNEDYQCTWITIDAMNSLQNFDIKINRLVQYLKRQHSEDNYDRKDHKLYVDFIFD